MATDLGRVGIVSKGAWANNVAYEELDMVLYNNDSYIAKKPVPAGTLPTNTSYWNIALTSAIVPTIISDTTSYAATTTIGYTGLSVTIPANKNFAFSLTASYSASAPAEVGITTNSTYYYPDDIVAGGEAKSCSYCGRTGNSAQTFYMWAKYASAGTNSISISGFYF